MATQKDIELAERFVAALELELDEISRRLNRPTPEIFTENVKWNHAVRALIAHAKKTVPAERVSDSFNCIGNICDLKEPTGVTCPDDSCDLDTGVREAPAEPQPGNYPGIPDSSDCKPIAIPDGWRELEPDEVPNTSDMREWMGGWHERAINSGQPYKFHYTTNIRKIEPANTSEIPKGSPPFHNPANAHDYNTMHDYFGK